MRRGLLCLALIGVAVVATGPMATAGIPSDGNIVYGCVLKKADRPLPKGNVRVIDGDIADCKGKEILVQWQALFVSDRAMKQDFASADTGSLLSRIDQLPISSWSYKSDAGDVTHVGPMAQDFNALFGTGSDRTISPVDANGVALGGIQALSDIVRTQRLLIAGLAIVALASLVTATYALRRVRAMTAVTMA